MLKEGTKICADSGYCSGIPEKNAEFTKELNVINVNLAKIVQKERMELDI